MRMTMREFEPKPAIQSEHFDLILEVPRHAPSVANAQSWHNKCGETIGGML